MFLRHAVPLGGEVSRHMASRALDYLLRYSETVTILGTACSAIFQAGEARLGGTALATVALTALTDGNAWLRYCPIALEFGRYLMTQQSKDGRFFSLYRRDGTADLAFDSLYYPGEAVLALSLLGEKTGERLYREAALNGATYLARKYATLATELIPHDHWFLLAVEHLDSGETVPREIVRSAARVAHAMIASAFCTENGRFVFWGEDARLCPAACRAEGLGATVRLLHRWGFRRQAYEFHQWLERTISFCLTCQITEEHWRLNPTWEMCDGSFVRDHASSVIRMDYVQHAINAIAGLLEARQCLDVRI